MTQGVLPQLSKPMTMAMATDIPFTPLYIDGEKRPASNGAKITVTNAFSGKIVGYAAAASSQDCTDAVEAAGRAFEGWEASTVMQRMTIIQKASQLLTGDKYREKVTQAMRAEISAVDEMCYFSVDYPAMIMLNSSGKIHLLRGETLPATMPGAYCMVQRRAKGVM